MSGIELDRLLENARWVRALGVELAGAGEADDLAQDAWVVALEHRGEVRNPAAWLAGVVRRLASRARRGNERRARREEAAAGPEAGPAADELVAEAELSRALIRAVTELEEPFRSTVLLRFYRGWTPDDIARSHGVPSATVRTRLHRALARLRERLDSEHGGREAWALAFASPGALATGTIGGGALLGTKLTLGAAAVVAVAVGTALWWGRDDSKASSAREEPRIAIDGETPAVRQTPPESPARAGTSAQRSSVAAGAAGVRIDEVLLYGSVTDLVGHPVTLEWFALDDEHGDLLSASGFAAGSYSLAGLPPGSYELRTTAKGCLSLSERLVLGDREAIQRHDLVLAPAPTIPFRVVDENGQAWKSIGVLGVFKGFLEVVVTPREPHEGLSGFGRGVGRLYRVGECVWTGDGEGSEVPPGYSGLVRTTIAPPFFASLTLRDATIATQRVDGPISELLFTLRHDEEAKLRGGVHLRVLDATTGAALSGGSVNLDPPSCNSGGGTPLDEHGGATLDSFAPGLYRLRLFHKEYADTGRSVRVPNGRIEELGDVLVWPTATIRGSIFDARGNPATAWVHASALADLRGPADLDGGLGSRMLGGRLELEGAARGPILLLVELPDHALLARTIDASSGLVEGLVLQAEEGVSVVLRTPEEWIGRQVTLADESGVPLKTWTVYRSTIPTRLAPGRYELWLGRAERVDSRQELVVGDAPLVVDLARGGG